MTAWPRADRAWTTAAALLGIALVLVATSTLGPGVSPDSAAYLSAARSAAAGEGYVKFDDEPYAHLPPLYPTILAAGLRLGLDPSSVSRVFNAVVLGLIVVAAHGLAGLHVRSRWAVAACVAAVVGSPTLLGVSIMVWSEPLFTLLLALVAIGLRRHELRGGHRDLLLAAVCAGLACLQRYAGVIVVAAAVIVVLLARERTPRLADRARRGAVFALVALLPIGLWVLRNVRLTKSSNLPLYPVGLTLAQALGGAADVLTAWVLPPRWPLGARLAVVAAVALAGGLLARRAGPGAEARGAWTARLRAPLVLTAVYAVAIFGILLTIHYEIGRLLMPTYIWVVVIVVVAVEEWLRRLRRLGRGGAAVAATIVAMGGLWLGYQGSRVARDVALDVAHGAGAYRRVFQRSATVDWVRATTLDGTLYSNAPEVIYLFAGKHARQGLVRRQDPRDFASGPPRYFVWFDRAPPNPVLDPDELARVVAATRLAQLADGAVYRLGPSPAGPSR